jgi:hypothetical protein
MSGICHLVLGWVHIFFGTSHIKPVLVFQLDVPVGPQTYGGDIAGPNKHRLVFVTK